MPQFCLHSLPALAKKTIMAQTLPPAPDPSSPLPRYERKRTGAAKAPRPRFQAADGALAGLFAMLFLAIGALGRGGHAELAPASLVSALTAGMAYLLAWRCGGRTCGIIAGSLTALSFGFAQASVSADTALLTLLIVASLFAFACEAPVAACALAGFAAALRLDGALLGVLLLALIAARARRQLPLSLGGFVAAALAGGSLRVLVLHAPFPAPTLGFGGGAAFWLGRPAQALALWLLVPLCAELTDPARRGRWLPAAWWGVLYLALTFCLHMGSLSDTALPLMPVVFVLAAGGLARLMPTIAGDIPALRYGLAALAVVALLGLRGQSEWTEHLRTVPAAETTGAFALPQPLPARDAPAQQPPPTIQTPAQQPPVINAPAQQQGPATEAPAALPQAAPPALAVPHPARRVRSAKQVPLGGAPAPLSARPIAKKTAPKPAVALFTLRNGRLVRRSKWAIQWDLTHPKTKP